MESNMFTVDGMPCMVLKDKDLATIACDVRLQRIQPSTIATALGKLESLTGHKPSRRVGLHTTTLKREKFKPKTEEKHEGMNAEYTKTLLRLEYLRRAYNRQVKLGKFKEGAKYMRLQLPCVQKLAELETESEIENGRLCN
jgi:hypothetical protein